MDLELEKKEREQQKFYEKLVKQTTEDFYARQADRLALERKWELNMNFLAGSQYVSINGRGEIVDTDKSFFWQKREVFNHIAPIMDTRIAKFSAISPVISVRPNTDDDKDVNGASLAEKLITEILERPSVKSCISKVTMWSETCGTGFYKLTWNNNGGDMVATVDEQKVYQGDVEVLTVSPFEIFPSSLYVEDVDDCESIIHARALKTSDVLDKYGVSVTGGEVDIYALSSQREFSFSAGKSTLSDAVIVIEKYEKPTKEFPNGRLITVAGDKLLYYGELPYMNGKNKTRTYPFIKQISQRTAGCFFGSSIIERLIPVQRAFNAVKNRKHEFLNRLSMSIMTVEDGAMDVDDLQEEGLSPGKVLVYRQGYNPPAIMGNMQMPGDFADEEEKLLNEFVSISGVADVSSSANNAKLSSGSALQLLVEQDNSRLVIVAEYIRNCILEISRQSLRLFAQFMGMIRAVKTKTDKKKSQVIYLDKNALNSDDVYIENENELLYSMNTKKEMIFKLYQSGILGDKNGEIRTSTKEKILSLLGYKDLDYQKGVSRLHEEKAQFENETIRKKGLEIEEIDNDEIHIDEHTRYVLSEYEELTEGEKERLFLHIKAHKERKNIANKI